MGVPVARACDARHVPGGWPGRGRDGRRPRRPGRSARRPRAAGRRRHRRRPGRARRLGRDRRHLRATGRGRHGGRPARGLGGAGGESLAQAVAYAEAHGGGTIAVSSQSGAAGQLIASGADVAAIGGFSGRESQVSVAWLADAVEQGRIRWLLVDRQGGGMPLDGRIGASEVMVVEAQIGDAVDSVGGLVDLQGKADALRAAAAS